MQLCVPAGYSSVHSASASGMGLLPRQSSCRLACTIAPASILYRLVAATSFNRQQPAHAQRALRERSSYSPSSLFYAQLRFSSIYFLITTTRRLIGFTSSFSWRELQPFIPTSSTPVFAVLLLLYTLHSRSLSFHFIGVGGSESAMRLGIRGSAAQPSDPLEV